MKHVCGTAWHLVCVGICVCVCVSERERVKKSVGFKLI